MMSPVLRSRIGWAWSTNRSSSRAFAEPAHPRQPLESVVSTPFLRELGRDVAEDHDAAPKAAIGGVEGRGHIADIKMSPVQPHERVAVDPDDLIGGPGCVDRTLLDRQWGAVTVLEVRHVVQ